MIADSKSNKQYASPSEWESHKATIKRLYLDEARTLPEVRTVMEKDYGFYATVNMYKKRLRAWQFSKNIQESDARMALQRTAESGAFGMFPFNVNGQPLGGKRLLRYLQRRPHLLFQTQPGEPLSKHATLAAELIRKSPPTRVSFDDFNNGPGSIGVLDTCMGVLRNFVRGTVILMNSQPGEWRHISMGQSTSSQKKLVLERDTDLVAFCDSFSYVADCLNTGSDPSIIQILHSQLDRLKNVLKQQNPDFMFALLSCCHGLNKRGRPELVSMLNRFILELSAIVLNERHPITIMWGHLSKCEPAEFGLFAERLQAASEDELMAALGMSKQYPNTAKDLSFAPPKQGGSKFIQARIANWLDLHRQWPSYQSKETLAEFDHYIADLMSSALDSFKEGRLAEAEQTIQVFYQTDFENRVWGGRDMIYWVVAGCALARVSMGDIEEAEAHFRMAAEVSQRCGQLFYRDIAMLSLRALASSPKVEETDEFDDDSSDLSSDKLSDLSDVKRASV